MSFTDSLKGAFEQGLMAQKRPVEFMILLTQLENFVQPEEGTGVIAVNDLDVMTCVKSIEQIKTVCGSHFRY